MINDQLYKEMMAVPEIAEAMELTKASSYTRAELEAYDKYWDAISLEKTFIADAKAEGKAENITATVLNLDDLGSGIIFISKAVKISENEVLKILRENGRLKS